MCDLNAISNWVQLHILVDYRVRYVIEVDVVFCFSSICKFGNFKYLFATITSLSERTLDSEDLICWYKQKIDFYEPWQQYKLLKTMEMS